MTDSHQPSDPEGVEGLDAERERVAAVLEGLKAGVLQRRAERATAGADDGEARARLLEAKRLEYVREPLPVSPRPVVGRFLVLARKAAYHLLFKWHARGTSEQQNAFNQAALRLVEDLLRADEAKSRDLARLRRRVDELEQRLAAVEPRASDKAGAPGGPREVGPEP